jgi:hypothetical protein
MNKLMGYKNKTTTARSSRMRCTGVSPAPPIDAATKQLMHDAEAALPPTASVADAALAFGASYALPGAMLTALHVLLTATPTQYAPVRSAAAINSFSRSRRCH